MPPLKRIAVNSKNSKKGVSIESHTAFTQQLLLTNRKNKMVKISVKGELWGKKRWGKKGGRGGRFLPEASWILYIQR